MSRKKVDQQLTNNSPPTPQEVQEEEAGWVPLAREELARLHNSEGGHIAKKKATVRHVVEATITPGDSINALFTNKARKKAAGICSKNIWTTKWSKDPLISSVLANVLKIAQEWYDTAELRKLKARQDEWKQNAHQMASSMVTKSVEMLKHPIEVEVVEEDDEGNPLILRVPAKWTFDTVARMAVAADKIGRLALDMHTDKTEQVGNVGVQHGVEGLEEEELNQLLRNLLVGTGMKLPAEVED